jgi:hypothetical protein
MISICCFGFNRFGRQWFWGPFNFDEINAGQQRSQSGEIGINRAMSVVRPRRALAWGALLLSALALGGCSTSIADLPLVGTPADAPARPKEAGGYLPVHDLPPDREQAAMAPAERAKVEAELVAARDRQASVRAKDTAPK